ncbi:RNA polymerase recycling motor HelD [Shouchella shacheensis]|uniref:RNA polymerase recycling motor HelD n=1 Tax=Shouchella shacheensis TaxID=1649580 RepID=UPI00073FAD42|nr:RNA polymerase recycling motor HelD [Shouchella shacheensis]
MSTNNDWMYEQERAAFIHAYIRTKQALLREKAEGVSSDEMELKETFWENVTVNLSNTEDAAETISSIKQQAELLNERERSGELVKRHMKTLRRLAESPYFGRIDLIEEGETKAEPIYIGLASLMDETENEFYIYDWRAPISSVYYDFGPGDVHYEAPAGVVHAMLENKRQYVFRRGALKTMFDTAITIGDERLKEALSHQANTQMKTIVSTIQKEQNTAIRDHKSRFLVVQGVAGSGKTSVAMQRAAYLLYKHRNSIHANQLVLFSPNQLFASYVSTVLPELGEENMAQMTFRTYVYKRLGKRFEVENGFEQLEYVLGAKEDSAYTIRLVGIREKAGLSFKDRLDAYVDQLEGDGFSFHDVTFRGRVLVSKSDLQTYFYCLNQDNPIQNRLRQTAEWLLKELAKEEGRERSSEWVEQERELVDKETLLKIHHEIQQAYPNEDVFAEEEKQHKRLARYLTAEAFKPLKKWVKTYGFVDDQQMYEAFLFADVHGNVEHWGAIALWTKDQLDHGVLPYEDATPYMYLQDRLKGLRVDRSIRHVFIDEAQDYSSFQLAFMQRLYPAARFTIVGDRSQALFTHATSQGVLQQLGEQEDVRLLRFSKSYRSTEPIMRFARELLPNPADVQPFEREGTKPTLNVVASKEALVTPVKDQLQAFADEEIATVAVITKTAREAADAHARLSEWFDIQLLKQDDHEYARGLVILPVYLAKGIEFDAVIVYDASDGVYGAEQERFHLYTACTRAMHKLAVFSIGQPSRWVEAVPGELYTKGS